MKTATPSTIARSVASAVWPDVQQQSKVCAGVYQFSCAGHGGLVAVLSAANLPTAAVDAARAAGLVYTVARIQQWANRTRTYCSAAGYSAQTLRANWLANPEHVQLEEVWIAEEDCDWATLAYVSEAVRDGLNRGRTGSAVITREDARGTLERWCGSFLTALGESAERAA